MKLLAPQLVDGIASLHPATILAAASGLTFLYLLSSYIYCVYFHPLSRLPGPKLWAASNIPYIRSWIGGRYAYKMKELHDRYGKVVRVGPSRVSFNSAASAKDIYGHNTGARKQFLKTNFYASSPGPENIASSIDPAEHSKMRKPFSHAFSAKALSDQEDIVRQYIDLFIAQLDRNATGPAGAEMVKWYNSTTFDIIGDMAFGEPFDSLKNGEPHFWIRNIFGFLGALTVVSALRDYFDPAATLSYIVPKSMAEQRNNHIQLSQEKMAKRINTPNTRKDFFHSILQKNADTKYSLDMLTSNAQVLIVAGSETTATALSGFSYYICRYPDAYQKLAHEIRSTFSRYDDIQNHTLEPLPYLRACISETLRIYPPVPFGPPRASPGETVDGIYIPRGVEVFTSPVAATHSEANFHRPSDFLPERWLDPDCKDSLEASQPFIQGSRACLGRSLALMELRIIIAKMLWVYDMELLDGKLDWNRDNQIQTLFVKPDLYMKFTRRPGIEAPSAADVARFA